LIVLDLEASPLVDLPGLDQLGATLKDEPQGSVGLTSVATVFEPASTVLPRDTW
jgi:hypothetical protein